MSISRCHGKRSPCGFKITTFYSLLKNIHNSCSTIIVCVFLHKKSFLILILFTSVYFS